MEHRMKTFVISAATMISVGILTALIATDPACLLWGGVLMDLWIVNPEIVERYKSGESIDALAAACGADSKTVRRAITEKTAKRRPRRGKTGPRKETIPKLAMAREMREKGDTLKVIGEALNMSAVGVFDMMKAHPVISP